MAIPILEIRTSLQVSTVGVPFTYQPAALNAPTSWTALYLPTGLSINSSTGAITGTPTTEGFWQTVLQATNVDGSDTVVLLMPVLPVVSTASPVIGGGLWSDLELDFDLTTRVVTIPGVTTEAGQPLFRVGRGDAFSLLVGATKYGVLQDLKPAAEVVTVECALKELEPESVVTLTGGATTKTGSNDTTRFRTAVEFPYDDWTSILGNYEEDEKTSHLAPTEISITVDLIRFTSLPFLVEVIRDQVPD